MKKFDAAHPMWNRILGVVYLPLVFVTVIMAFLCLVISVLVCAMDAAVTIREENDLTI